LRLDESSDTGVKFMHVPPHGKRVAQQFDTPRKAKTKDFPLIRIAWDFASRLPASLAAHLQIDNIVFTGV
jgi:hypothetical protein